MGLREILTTPIGFRSSKFFWKEPVSYRVRLRGDGWLRLGVVLGSWALGIGVFGLLFAQNIHRPGPVLAVGLGSLFGGVAALMVFFLRDHVSGRVHVEEDEIRRYRSYAGIAPGGWTEWQHWPYAAIDSCMIIPSSVTGKSFSVLVITLDDEREIVGVPGSIDLTKLAKFLAAKGVKVTQGKAIPRPYTAKLNAVIAGAVPVLGVVMLVVGISWLLSARRNPAGNRPEHGLEAQRIAERGLPEPAEQPGLQADWPVQDSTVPPGQNAAAKSRKTEMVGAPGGFDFASTHPDNEPVIGFRSTFGSWAGKQWIGRLEPLYGGEPPDPSWQTVTAKPGYVVAGLLVDTPEFVNAYAVIFQRMTPQGTLDPDDSYISDWIGPKSETPEKAVSGDGKKVLGIHGRAGAILNAVGLVIEFE